MSRFILSAALLALAACETPVGPAPDASASNSTPTAASLTVSGAYVPAAPAGGTSGLFFTVSAGPTADTLLAVQTDVAARTEIHESIDAGDGMRGMRAVQGVPVPVGTGVALAPGGTHAMLFEVTQALAPGDTVRAVALFARAGEVPVVAVVRSLQEM